MKTKLLLTLFSIFLCFGTTSCVSVKVKPKYHKEKSIPPGQAKKMMGSKSAKHYAPGHNK